MSSAETGTGTGNVHTVSNYIYTGGPLFRIDLYDAYGTKLAGNPSNDPFGYNGKWGYYTDYETANTQSSGGPLILCTYRYYDPSEGRWLTRDPIGYGGGVNLYGYVYSNPIINTDPSGTSVKGCLAAACATACRAAYEGATAWASRYTTSVAAVRASAYAAFMTCTAVCYDLLNPNPETWTPIAVYTPKYAPGYGTCYSADYASNKGRHAWCTQCYGSPVKGRSPKTFDACTYY